MTAADKALLEGLIAGDLAAFNQIYERDRARLFAFVLRLSGGYRALAEDICQETWLRLARHAPRLAPDSRVGAWLLTVARNLFISHVRHRRLLDEWVPEFHADEGPSPYDTARGGELAGRAERAIAALPLKYREVILLCAGEKLGPKEAAAVLDIKPEAVRQRLSRARAKLRDALADRPAARAARR